MEEARVHELRGLHDGAEVEEQKEEQEGVLQVGAKEG